MTISRLLFGSLSVTEMLKLMNEALSILENRLKCHSFTE